VNTGSAKKLVRCLTSIYFDLTWRRAGRAEFPEIRVPRKSSYSSGEVYWPQKWNHSQGWVQSHMERGSISIRPI